MAQAGASPRVRSANTGLSVLPPRNLELTAPGRKRKLPMLLRLPNVTEILYEDKSSTQTQILA